MLLLLLSLIQISSANFQVNIQGAGTFYIPAPIVYNIQDPQGPTIELLNLYCEPADPQIFSNSFEKRVYFRAGNSIHHPFKSFIYHTGNMMIDIVPEYPVRCVRPYVNLEQEDVEASASTEEAPLEKATDPSAE